MCRHRPAPPLSCPTVGPNRPPVGCGGARAPPPRLTRLSIIGRRAHRGRMRRLGGIAPGARACDAAHPVRSADRAGAVQGLRRRTPRGRSRAGSSSVAEGDVGALAAPGPSGDGASRRAHGAVRPWRLTAPAPHLHGASGVVRRPVCGRQPGQRTLVSAVPFHRSELAAAPHQLTAALGARRAGAAVGGGG